ncbi:MAG TPA: methylmalonyl-CoA mutase family protein [Saprospiraceae bacterium]|nr:methylmalonyl-CoA mutase family protein [Saprospiraceae bacterium]
MSEIKLTEFPHTTKSDWQFAVEKELKGEAYETMLFEIDGIQFDPYYTQEEARYFQGNFPRYGSTMLAGENFDFTKRQSPLSELSESVHLNMKAPYIFIDEETNLDLIFSEQMKGIQPIIYSTTLTERIESKLKGFMAMINFILISTDKSNIQSFYPIELDLNNAIQQSGAQFLTKLDSIKDHFTGIFLNLTLSGKFTSDIAKARALKILWYNWLEKNNLMQVKKIFINIRSESYSHFPTNAISDTLNVIIADACQADRLEINTSGKNHLEKNTLRHTYNVASIEAGIGKVPDPVGGSYFWEYAASELANRVWQEVY